RRFPCSTSTMPEAVRAIYTTRRGSIDIGIRVSDGRVALVRASETSVDELSTYLLSRRAPERERHRFDHLPLTETGRVSLMVAQRCNLRCWYCYGGGNGEYGSPGMLSLQDAAATIDALMTSDESRIVVNFFGGEPL